MASTEGEQDLAGGWSTKDTRAMELATAEANSPLSGGLLYMTSAGVANKTSGLMTFEKGDRDESNL
jgi:hypothetical protein